MFQGSLQSFQIPFLGWTMVAVTSKAILKCITMENGELYAKINSTGTIMEQLLYAEWWGIHLVITVLHTDKHLWHQVQGYGLTICNVLVLKHTSIDAHMLLGDLILALIVKTLLFDATVIFFFPSKLISPDICECRIAKCTFLFILDRLLPNLSKKKRRETMKESILFNYSRNVQGFISIDWLRKMYHC